MKKFVSLLLAVVLLCVLCVPAFAVGDFADGQTIPGGSYSHIIINENATVTIDSEVTIDNNGAQAYLTLPPGSTLVIGSNGFLAGTKVAFNWTNAGQKIKIEKGGGLKIVFMDNSRAVSFANFLNDSGITYSRTGTTVQAGAPLCAHADTYTTTYTTDTTEITKTTYTTTFKNTICNECGKTVSTENMGTTETTETIEPIEPIEPTPTGSILSEGSLTIIVGIAAAVVFGFGGFILGTKKKKKNEE